ncbi:hypothetical protein IFM89_031351 [Coptis chinensis]|uniref:EF-hand domain-containing protein n=1 Tax=Coptis chinensis TaxID=261450 RepID=A0A835IYT5_9MAGN|nr:hypothetical protein IFM89_031351 [Coptis chinensis]
MEKTSSNTLSPFSLAGLIWFLLFDGVLNWIIEFKKFYSSSRCFFQSLTEFFVGKSKGGSEKKIANSELLKHKLSLKEKVEDGKLSREDVEMVMGNLRIVCNPDEDKPRERLGLHELSVLFEEKEPSVEEVKEAFDIFDENRDGFVDASELQRVICSLGFKEGSKLVDCETMIRAFDENRDGKIDFNEFVKLMENSFC